MNYFIEHLDGNVVKADGTFSNVMDLLGVEASPLDVPNDGRGQTISAFVIDGKQYAVSAILGALNQRIVTLETSNGTGFIGETGTTSLTNSLEFPFNNSQKTVALVNRQDDTDYVVFTEIQSATGNPGEIVISDKQVNGFKIAHTGGASAVTVKYYVIGGLFT